MFINEQKRWHENEAIIPRIYNNDVNSLVKQHYVACGMQISKKLMCIMYS